MVSALDVELARSRLSSTIQEMTHLLYRSAYSTLMRESRDCSFMLLSDRGEVVVGGPGHFHHASYRRFAQAVMTRYPDLREGDVYLTNHPYEAGIPHTPDLALLAPAFADGRLVGFSASIAHKADFGGAVVGSATMESTHIFQEGLLVPPLLARRDGQDVPAVTSIIAANIRNSDLFFGDMRAQVGVTTLGAARLAALAYTTGVDVLLDVYDELLAQNERVIRGHVAGWPDGTARAEGFLDSDGIDADRPVRLAVEVTVRGDRVTFDFSRSNPQTPGPVNMPLIYSDTAVTYALLAMSDPSLTYNDGILRALQIEHGEATVLNPSFPAPVGAATSMHHRLIDLCIEALGHFAPARGSGHSGGSGGTLAISWRSDRSGARSLQYEVLGSAMGGLADQDGASGVCVYCTNLAVTPVEVIESQFPVVIRRFELVRDSAGPGEHRGGLSYRREYEALQPATVIRRAERSKFPAGGAAGGGPGRVAQVTLIRADGAAERVPVAGRYELRSGDRIRVEGAGAGGYGDPFRRPADVVAADVARGCISAESAERDYGVVVAPSGEVDAGRTRQLRSRPAAGGTGEGTA